MEFTNWNKMEGIEGQVVYLKEGNVLCYWRVDKTGQVSCPIVPFHMINIQIFLIALAQARTVELASVK